jgi:HEAT repeat protein
MPVPADIRRRTRACLTDDGASPTETASALLDAFVSDSPYTDALADAIVEIARAHPGVVGTLLPELDSYVVEGVEADRVYRAEAVALAFDLVAVDPTAADPISDLVAVVHDTSFDNWDLDALLISLAASNPQFLADNVEVLVDSGSSGQTLRPSRGWALARAHRTDPEAFAPVRESLRADLASTDADRRTALERVGAIGLAVPALVAPLVPDVVDAARSTADESRVAALDALGHVVGTESRTDDRYGNPLTDPPSSVFDAFDTALEDSDPDVVAGAATAYARAVAHDEARRDPVFDALLDRLATAEDPTVRAAYLDALDSLSRTVDGEHSVAPLVAAATPPNPPEERETALRALGRVSVPADERDDVERAFVDGLSAAAEGVRRAAADGTGDWLTDDPSTPLVDALAEATRDDSQFVREDALEALAATGDGADPVRTALAARLDDPDTVEVAATTAARLGAGDVVETLVDRVADAFTAGADDETPADPTAYAAGHHLTDAQSALADALAAVAGEAPGLLAPHAERLLDLRDDAEAVDSHRLAEAVAAVAAETPDALRAHAERIERELDEGAREPDAGHLLDARLAVGAVDDAVVERAVERYDAPALAPALARLEERDPLLALRVLSDLTTRLRVDDDHLSVGWWIHELPPLGTADKRVAAVAVDFWERLLGADDDWLRWDGAKALADLADFDSQVVEDSVPALVDALDDWNRHVPQWAVTALGHAGDDAVRSAVEPFTSHPDAPVRDAAATALDRLDASSDGESNASPPSARTLSADDPLERALAAYDAGEAADDAPVDDLRACLDDDEPLVRRWAVRALGAVGEADPDAVAPYADALATRLNDPDDATRAYAVRAFDRLADADPTLLADAVEPLVDCLTVPSVAVRVPALETLARAPPADLAAVPDAPGTVLSFFGEDAFTHVTTRAATLVSVVAAGDPAALVGHLDELTDELGWSAVRNAVALVARDHPDAVGRYEDELAEAKNDVYVRRALARVGSDQYLDCLRDSPNSLEAEVETFVAFVRSTPRQSSRASAVQVASGVTMSDPALAGEVVRALGEGLDSTDPAVRKRVASALAEAASAFDHSSPVGEFVPALVDLTDDDRWEVRGQAMRAVEAALAAGAVADDAVGALTDAALERLDDDHAEVRRRAASILGNLPESTHERHDVVDRAFSALDADDVGRQRGGALAVGSVAVAAGRHADAVDALTDAVEAADPWVRRNAIEGLETVVTDGFDADAVREVMRAARDDPNPSVREAAEAALDGFEG